MLNLFQRVIIVIAFFILPLHGKSQGVYLGSVSDTLRLGCCNGCYGIMSKTIDKIPATFHFTTHQVTVSFEFEGKKYEEKFRAKVSDNDTDYTSDGEDFQMADYQETKEGKNNYSTEVMGDGIYYFKEIVVKFFMSFSVLTEKPICIYP